MLEKFILKTTGISLKNKFKDLSESVLNKGLLNFLKNSPTPFHAVANMVEELKQNGFKELEESKKWSVKKGGKYFVTRNGSSIIAFKMGKSDHKKSGFRMVGAHTDSPCLKAKPNPIKKFKNYLQLSVETYGGVLLAPWFDRDLSLAGRVSYLDKKGKINSVNIDFKKAIATVPSLAIHLDRKANENRSINKQKHMPPVLMQLEEGEEVSLNDLLTDELKKAGNSKDVEKILEHELYFYDTQAPAQIGLNKQFIASARLDNLLSCYVGMVSLIDSDDSLPALITCNEHEEVGSSSAAGAAGPFLKSALERLAGTNEGFSVMVNSSYMVSVDNAHGIHPNFSDVHDENHGPILNQGPVIKINNNQRYATNSDTSAVFSYLCEKVGVPYQKFVTRSDLGCGSTIGPISATTIGVNTLDVGVPTFGMHSIRETAGSKDSFYLFKVLREFFNEKKAF